MNLVILWTTTIIHNLKSKYFYGSKYIFLFLFWTMNRLYFQILKIPDSPPEKAAQTPGPPAPLGPGWVAACLTVGILSVLLPPGGHWSFRKASFDFLQMWQVMTHNIFTLVCSSFWDTTKINPEQLLTNYCPHFQSAFCTFPKWNHVLERLFECFVSFLYARVIAKNTLTQTLTRVPETKCHPVSNIRWILTMKGICKKQQNNRRCTDLS